jgi:hypothetical protein
MSSLQLQDKNLPFEKLEEEKQKPELWATIQTPPFLSFFGKWLEAKTYPRSPAHSLKFSITPWPEYPEEKKLDATNTLVLKMNMGNWSTLPPSGVFDRLFNRRTFDGFFTLPNAITYSRSPDKQLTMFIYYANDNTSLGSLYWTVDDSMIQNRMPLDTISTIWNGRVGSFFSQIPNEFLNHETITNNCFSLQTSSGFMLNFNVGSLACRLSWQKYLRHYAPKIPIY